MDYVDYYKTLGIDKTATQKDIKSAYRKLARKFHPDLNPQDADAKRKFQQINEANEVLADPEKRKKYDQYGEGWKHTGDFENAGQQQRPFSGQQQGDFGNMGAEGSFSDFFETLFGRQHSSRGNTQTRFRGKDYSTEITLDLASAARTHKQTLNVDGQKIRITIPAGIENGQTIKIPGHGENGQRGSESGDLYITFIIPDNDKIKRIGNDLFSTVELNLYAAILGGQVLVNTLTGEVKVKVAAGTQNGGKVKLKGKGFPLYKKDGLFGDLIITWNILTPTHLSEKQRQLFTQLSEL